MSFFEAGMLVCFGLSWPFSIAKAIRTRNVAGKSRLFMSAIALGYVFGLLHKVTHNLDAVTALYAINLVMVLIDLSLYFKYRPRV